MFASAGARQCTSKAVMRQTNQRMRLLPGGIDDRCRCHALNHSATSPSATQASPCGFMDPQYLQNVSGVERLLAQHQGGHYQRTVPRQARGKAQADNICLGRRLLKSHAGAATTLRSNSDGFPLLGVRLGLCNPSVGCGRFLICAGTRGCFQAPSLW
jgi:hypothetical protein